MQTMETRRWRVKGPEMKGPIARWYARVRGSKSQIEAYRNQAAQLTAGLPDGARVLEVAAGPGYLSIELARLRRLDVTALDISHTFVEIGSNSARQEGVSVDFQQGDVAKMPFEADSFDFIVCQAAFKNFASAVRGSVKFLKPAWQTMKSNEPASNGILAPPPWRKPPLTASRRAPLLPTPPNHCLRSR